MLQITRVSVLVTSMICWAQNTPTTPLSISVCDVLNNPAKYDNTMVSITANIVVWDESMHIEDQSCGGSLKIEDRKYLAAIAIVSSRNVRMLKRPPSFETRDSALSKLNADQSGRVKAMFEGRLDGYPRARINGKAIGYGHLSMYPALLLVKDLKIVSVGR